MTVSAVTLSLIAQIMEKVETGLAAGMPPTFFVRTSALPVKYVLTE